MDDRWTDRLTFVCILSEAHIDVRAFLTEPVLQDGL